MKGLMFKEDLFKKVVDGSKIQTRRTGGLDMANAILTDDEYDEIPEFKGMEIDPEIIKESGNEMDTITWKGLYPSFYIPYSELEYYILKPRYQLNEIVYLKEPFFKSQMANVNNEYGLIYKYSTRNRHVWRWSNKMFMPERYARYFIKITNIRVERLYDISEQDAKAEGVKPDRLLGFGAIGLKSYREGFFIKWIEVNGMKSFDTNPFVFIYDLELFTPPQ